MRFLTLPFLLLSLPLCGENLAWELFPNGKDIGEPKLAALEKGFSLSLKNANAKNNYAVVFANVPESSFKAGKIVVRYKGSPSNGNAVLTPSACVSDAKDEWKGFNADALPLNGQDERTVELMLASDFNIKDSGLNLRQIKFVIQSQNEPAGKISSVEVLEVKLESLSDEDALRAAKTFHWSLLGAGTVGKASVVDTARGCSLSLVNIQAQNNYATALAQCDLQVAAQNKLVFRYCPKAGSGQASLTPTLAIVRNGVWQSFSAPSVKLDGKEFKTVSFGLNTDFQLSDAVWNVRQVKFTINASSDPVGTESSVDIEDLRFVSADEAASFGGLEPVLIPNPNKTVKALPAAAQTKVFFDFDNDDYATKIESRTAQQAAVDNPGPGFRDVLLEGAESLFKPVETPEAADVIVYARAVKSPLAAREAAAVRSGKGLLLFGFVPDAELAALSPLRLEKIPQKGWEARRALTAPEKANELVAGEKLADGDFGVYFKSELSAGGEAFLRYSDGSPAAASLSAGGMKAIHSTATPGSALLKSDAFYDRFALKSICWLAGRKLDSLDVAERRAALEKKAARLSAALGVLKDAGLLDSKNAKLASAGGLEYQIGASFENFGRFGWLLGEGLSVGNLSRDMTIANGEQSFRLNVGSDISTSLPLWRMKAVAGEVAQKSELNGAERPYDFVWSGVGSVECRCAVFMKSEWRGRDIFIAINDGIDDLDKTYFNGTQVGETDEKTPCYWQAPRRYRIPAELVKWDAQNEISIRVSNLRGNARINSCPKLLLQTPGRKAAPTAYASSIDWTCKAYEISADGVSYRLFLSLLSPYSLYELPGGQDFQLCLENVATKAAWLDRKGLHCVDLLSSPAEFYNAARDGRWSAPWLLLWRDRETKPLLIAFKSQPEALLSVANGAHVDALEVKGSGKAQAFCAGWPWGAEPVDASSWKSAPPESVLKKLDASCEMALNYPVGCEEAFAIAKTDKRVKIVDSFKFHPVEDEWKTPKAPFALLPPLAGLAVESGSPLVEAKGCEPFGVATKFGPLYGVSGKACVEWSMPLPSQRDFLYATISPDDGISAQADEIFEAGSRWSCGGHVPVGAWTPEQPAGSLKSHNIDLFAWGFGLGNALQGALPLSNACKEILAERTRVRYIEPLELYQYKYFARHRMEPLSGLTYPIVFNSYYPNNARYAKDFGSSVIYGDSNEACAVALWVAELLADSKGRVGLVRSNWSYFKYVMRYAMRSEDWAFNSGSCREYGTGAWIDMLDCEYSLMLCYARLAELCGDQALADEAEYRAAKRMLPTLLRIDFKNYLAQRKMLPRSASVAVVTGFSETEGAVCLNNPPSGDNFNCANDLFDFSQGFCGSLRALYWKYADKELQRYVDEFAIPALLDKDGKLSKAGPAYLMPIAFYSKDSSRLKGFYDEVLAAHKKSLMNDWPGIAAAPAFHAASWRLNGRFHIAEFRNLRIDKAEFNPQTGAASLSCEGKGIDSALGVSCDRRLDSALRNGKPVSLSQEPDGFVRLPVALGANSFELRFK